MESDRAGRWWTEVREGGREYGDVGRLWKEVVEGQGRERYRREMMEGCTGGRRSEMVEGSSGGRDRVE